MKKKYYSAESVVHLVGLSLNSLTSEIQRDQIANCLVALQQGLGWGGGVGLEGGGFNCYVTGSINMHAVFPLFYSD